MGKRKRFTAIFVRKGRRYENEQEVSTVLLRNICHNGHYLASHQWMDEAELTQAIAHRRKKNKSRAPMIITEGSAISFSATVEIYERNAPAGSSSSAGSQESFACALTQPMNIKVEKSDLFNPEGGISEKHMKSLQNQDDFLQRNIYVDDERDSSRISIEKTDSQYGGKCCPHCESSFAKGYDKGYSKGHIEGYQAAKEAQRSARGARSNSRHKRTKFRN